METSSYAIPDDSQEWRGEILDDQQVSGHTVRYSLCIGYNNISGHYPVELNLNDKLNLNHIR